MRESPSAIPSTSDTSIRPLHVNTIILFASTSGRSRILVGVGSLQGPVESLAATMEESAPKAAVARGKEAA
jgi:hypothetical protein